MRYALVLVGVLCIALTVIVYVYLGFTQALIVAQFVAVIFAFGFIIDSRLRHQKAVREKRPEWWTGLLVEGKKIHVRVDWNSCMGAASCVELAPKVFRLDWEKKKSIFDPAPLQLLDEKAKGTDPEKVFFAAQSCPYRAIILEDDETRERIFP